MKELKPFEYHPDPIFNDLMKKVITEASIIIVTVSTGCSGLLGAAVAAGQRCVSVNSASVGEEVKGKNGKDVESARFSHTYTVLNN